MIIIPLQTSLTKSNIIKIVYTKIKNLIFLIYLLKEQICKHIKNFQNKFNRHRIFLQYKVLKACALKLNLNKSFNKQSQALI